MSLYTRPIDSQRYLVSNVLDDTGQIAKVSLPIHDSGPLATKGPMPEELHWR